MDLYILEVLKEKPMSGYDFLSLIHKKFDILLSSGTVYSLLYSMERKGLIKGIPNERKRIYTLTEKGKQSLKDVQRANGEIQVILKNLQLL